MKDGLGNELGPDLKAEIGREYQRCQFVKEQLKALGVAFFLFALVMAEFGDEGWAIFWAAVGLIAIVSIHVMSREHSQIEDTPNEIKRIIK
uniref:2TM domain-containing protein n=1 Tax=Candidatus Kentrum sp. SD TaxID=2126332 RepID=A0A451BRI5_9GAMM|nr:MAG: hypothetical protein BECKSD772D_GA0070982_11794 [Candidatus Kentron sp. SD]